MKRTWEAIEDFAGWWWESLTIAFNLVILAGLALVVVTALNAAGWLRVVGVVIGLLVVLVGLRLQFANWREERPRGAIRGDARAGVMGADQNRFF